MKSEQINLKIGLMQYEPGWEIILNQIGVSWNVISSFTDNLSSSYSAIILNTTYTTNQKIAIERFLTEGGAILSVYGFAEQILSLRARTSYFDSVAPLDLEYCSTRDILDVNAYGRVIGSEDIVSMHHILNGTIINIPFDVHLLMINGKSKRKNFYSKKERLPNEKVSSVSKSQLRTLVASALEFLHHKRGLPFIHKWYFPKNEPTIFTFRIDSDKGNQYEIEELYQLSDRFEIPTTWFLDVKSHEQWLPYFSKFVKQEIGIHCYEHITDKTVSGNFDNFEKALMLLKKFSTGISGAAAPRGMWNESVSLAFEKLGLTYSSEFSFDYDNLPSFPWLGDKFSSVVQLPIHPICSGSMRRAGFSNNEQLEYFLRKIDHNSAMREPICFYHHPTHHFNDVFEQIFRYISEKNFKKISYAEYAAWWGKRVSVHQEFVFTTATKMIYQTSGTSDAEVWNRISISPGEEIIQHINKDVYLGALSISQRPLPVAIPNDIMRTRIFDWRHHLINILELYYKLKR